jgi:hypothetical protein
MSIGIAGVLGERQRNAFATFFQTLHSSNITCTISSWLSELALSLWIIFCSTLMVVAWIVLPLYEENFLGRAVQGSGEAAILFGVLLLRFKLLFIACDMVPFLRPLKVRSDISMVSNCLSIFQLPCSFLILPNAYGRQGTFKPN